MRAIRVGRWAALPALLGVLALPAASQAPQEKVTLKVVKYDELTKTLNSLKGKVVVVDFWADT
jgi:hypothetical protein